MLCVMDAASRIPKMWSLLGEEGRESLRLQSPPTHPHYSYFKSNPNQHYRDFRFYTLERIFSRARPPPKGKSDRTLNKQCREYLSAKM
jgi:hypothetical protein